MTATIIKFPNARSAQGNAKECDCASCQCQTAAEAFERAYEARRAILRSGVLLATVTDPTAGLAL